MVTPLSVSSTPRLGLVLLPLGMALGPHGLGVLSDSVLGLLDPAVSVALAALGVIVGLHFTARRPRERLLIAAATVEAGVTTLIVFGGILVLHVMSRRAEPDPWLLALMLGVCASASSTSTDTGTRRASSIMRIGDLDDALPIVLGALALGWMRQGSPIAGAWFAAQAGVIALIIAVAGWLLVTQTSSDGEQRVFAVGTLLLLGGATAHLSLSALFAGFLAGAFWNAVPSLGRDRLASDTGYLQHPLIVLLLLVAGARLELSITIIALVGTYLVCRVAGKIVGGWLVARTMARDLPPGLGSYLISPGVVGIAFALNVLQAGIHQDTVEMLFAIAVAGSFGSELISLLIPHPEERA